MSAKVMARFSKRVFFDKVTNLSSGSKAKITLLVDKSDLHKLTKKELSCKFVGLFKQKKGSRNLVV